MSQKDHNCKGPYCALLTYLQRSKTNRFLSSRDYQSYLALISGLVLGYDKSTPMYWLNSVYRNRI